MGVADFGRRLREAASRRAAELAPPASGEAPLLEDRGLDVFALLGLMALGKRAGGGASRLALPKSFEEGLAELQKTGLSGAPVDPDQAQQAIALLRDGRAREDLEVSLAAVVGLLQRLPGALIDDVFTRPDVPLELVDALRRDLGDLANQPRQLLERLRSGQGSQTPKVLSNSLESLLALASLGSVVGTLRALIAPDNETVRLAILIYARSQGWDIGPADLDAVYKALDPKNPNAGELLDAGLTRLRERSGRGEFREILARLTS